MDEDEAITHRALDLLGVPPTFPMKQAAFAPSYSAWPILTPDEMARML